MNYENVKQETKMDILRFVPSRAMRKHLKKIGYEFNALECAWLVYQCETAILAEKHAAWQEIIDTMPDCEIDSEYLPHRSLHEFLKQYMKIEDRAIQHFFESEDNAFYQFSLFYRSTDYKPYYNTYDECFSAAIKYLEENDLLEEEPFIYMAKVYNGGTHEHVKFKPDGRIISTCPYFLSEEELHIYDVVFQKMDFIFPTPFKKGDILFDVRCREYPNHNLMVFDRTDVIFDEKTIVNKNGLYCTYGYVMEDGRIIQDGFNCLYLEYYESDCFANEYRTLDYVRKYLLGKLSLTELMNKYHQILCEEYAKNTALHLGLWEDDTIDEEWKSNWFFEQTEHILS